MFENLKSCLIDDLEKKKAIDEILNPVVERADFCEDVKQYLYAVEVPPEKYCPECLKQYPGYENICFDCMVRLKNIKDMKSVRDITSKPYIDIKGKNIYEDFDEIFTDGNAKRLEEFDFTFRDYKKITRNIKSSALKQFDSLIKENEILTDHLNVYDFVLLFAKSFVNVEFKSYGGELGIYLYNTIDIDERLTRSLLITTLIHELSHFLIKEIITHILCGVLDCTKNSYVEAVSTFILSYSPFTQLIDEYCAHTVEGRFTLFGYQDYSSYLQIEKSIDDEMDRDEIEVTKSIGNTFSISIKDILESVLDDEVREKIKEQFLNDTIDRPNYGMLKMENCTILKDEGFVRAIWLILNEGFAVAGQNIEKLKEYEECF